MKPAKPAKTTTAGLVLLCLPVEVGWTSWIVGFKNFFIPIFTKTLAHAPFKISNRPTLGQYC